jgi:hypothetical protein
MRRRGLGQLHNLWKRCAPGRGGRPGARRGQVAFWPGRVLSGRVDVAWASSHGGLNGRGQVGLAAEFRAPHGRCQSLSITFYTAILALVEPSSRVTIRDVAARADVSVATVSTAVSRQYGAAADPSARVKVVPDDLGFPGRPVWPNPRRHPAHVTGILVADLEPFSTGRPRDAAGAVCGFDSGPGLRLRLRFRSAAPVPVCGFDSGFRAAAPVSVRSFDSGLRLRFRSAVRSSGFGPRLRLRFWSAVRSSGSGSGSEIVVYAARRGQASGTSDMTSPAACWHGGQPARTKPQWPMTDGLR